MSEELDQVEEVAAPEPEAAPEPAVESTPEPEFTYEPEFITNEQPAHSVQPEPQQPQWSPQQVAAYNDQIRQQPSPQQYQQPQQNTAEMTLNRLVQNPDGTISEIAGQAAQQVSQQMMQQYMNPMGQQMNAFIQGQANYHTAASDENIKSMYNKEFSKDETFASNERVRARVDTAIQGLRHQAINQARAGDPSGFAIFNNPTFSKGVLALAKIMEGHTPTAAEVAAIPHVERTTPAATAPTAVEIDPDTRSALQRVGISEERYIKGLEDNAKYDDFQG